MNPTEFLCSQGHEELLFRQLTDALPHMIWLAGPDGGALYQNRRLRDYTGYDFDEMPGTRWERIIHPDDLALIRRAWSQAMETGVLAQVEYRLRRHDGTYRWHSSQADPQCGPGGSVLRWVGTCTDIDDQRRLTTERDELIARLKLQIERMPLAYLLFDADMRITDWNSAATRVFGYAKEEVLGMGPPFAKLLPPDAWPPTEQVVGRIRAGDMSAHSVNENLTKDGRTITCEWYNTPLLGHDGRFEGLISLAQDVTERKVLHEQLQQAQKMEAFGQLAGGVAHDFNNLLTIISGCSEILLDTIGSDNPMRETVKAISDAGKHAASLTRQLLAFSRKTVLEPKVLDLNEVVRETEKMLLRIIGEDIAIAAVLDSAISRVKVDPGQLGQVLMNLAVNARDAMPLGGKFTIETRSVDLDRDYARVHSDVSPGHYVLLSISDTGTGMTPEVKARIFEPFFTTKGVGKGTGLGLAVVLGIIKQSGGHVEVYSEPNIGTTFKIYFPAVQERVSASKEGEVGPAGRGAERVLLVEDEESVRLLAMIALQNYGYNVLAAKNGKEALALAEEQHGEFDLLVTDVVMPIISGPALAEALKPRFPDMKVLFSSGYTDDAVVRHGLLQEKVAFLHKPYTPLSLVSRVRQVLDGK